MDKASKTILRTALEISAIEPQETRRVIKHARKIQHSYQDKKLKACHIAEALQHHHCSRKEEV